MADVLSKLQAFFREQSGRPFAWGSADCAFYLADWVMEAKEIADPAAAWRGTYSDQAGAAAILEAQGGFVALVTSLAENAACPVTADPDDGDIAIIDLSTGLTGAIMTSGSWAFRTAKGLAWTRVPAGRVVKAWRVSDA